MCQGPGAPGSAGQAACGKETGDGEPRPPPRVFLLGAALVKTGTSKHEELIPPAAPMVSGGQLVLNVLVESLVSWGPAQAWWLGKGQGSLCLFVAAGGLPSACVLLGGFCDSRHTGTSASPSAIYSCKYFMRAKACSWQCLDAGAVWASSGVCRSPCRTDLPLGGFPVCSCMLLA